MNQLVRFRWKVLGILAGILLSFSSLFSQNPEENRVDSPMVMVFGGGSGIPDAITISYYGEMAFHTGLKVGYERILPTSFLKPTIERTLYVAASAGYVSHRTVYRSAFAQGEVGFRWLPFRRTRLGVFGTFGMLRYGLASPAYELQENGEFAPTSSGGWRFLSSLGGEIAIQGERISVFSRSSFAFLTPHNQGTLTQYIFELGLSIYVLPTHRTR